MQELFQSILLTPLFQLLLFLYTQTGNFGVAILLFTVIVRTVILPLSLPMVQSQKKMKLLAPEIAKLKKKHKDAAALQQAQMELYKEHNINPLAGCLPYILQLVVIFALYHVLQHFVGNAQAAGVTVATSFLGIDLAIPDPTYVLPVLAALTQLVLSVMLLPGVEHHDIVPDGTKDKPTQKANEKETDAQAMAESMQKQMIFIMPFMTGFFALRFPSGLALYWVATTVFSIVQQWVLSGPGGLQTILPTLRKWVRM